MDRSELEDLAAAALLEGKRDAYVSQTVAEAYEVAITVIDVVEPLIREDERARQTVAYRKVLGLLDDQRADLRARVEALRDDMSHNNGAVAMADAVLALLDEGTP